MTDFMPLQGWDHVELWVGNAKQAAYYYEQAFGFTRTAYAGPETGVRDRASYVLEQGDIRFVLTSGLRGAERGHRVRLQARGQRQVDRAAGAERGGGVPPGRPAGRARNRRAALGRGRVRPGRASSIGTYGEVIHTFVNRGDYAGPYLPGYRSTLENGQPPAGSG